MFGYVRIARAELRIREYEYYRAAYCGLCRSMGKCTGQCSRLTLSYDIAFLSQVRVAISDIRPQFRRRRCLRHPIRPRMMMEPNEELMYAADAAALLAYEKGRDNVADKRGLGRLFARLGCLFLKPAYRRAKKRLPALAAALREKLADLAAIERAAVPSLDRPAAVFGEILSLLMAHGYEGAKARIAATVGRQIGKYIYILDAVDDLKRDAKTGNYNPVLLVFGKEPTEEDRRLLQDTMLCCLSDAGAAFDLLGDGLTDHPNCRAVIENMLYLGMPATLQRVLYGEACHKEDKNE